MNVAMYVIREILVNLIGYKLRLRRLLGRGVINNVTGNLEMDLKDKGQKHNELINTIINDFGLSGIEKNRMLEMGPGGTLLHGLVSILDDWKEYIAVDAFPSAVWSGYPMSLYERYAKSLPRGDADVARQVIESSKRKEGSIKYYGSDGLENKQLNNYIKPATVDLIYSWGVLEHIKEPEKVFQDNFRLLDDKGVAIHIVDTHPHTWSRFKNPYWFLTIPEWLWKIMYGGRGFINRYRASSYIDWAKQAGFKVDIYKKEISECKLEGLKEKFIKQYRDASDEEILTDRLYMVLTK